MKSVDILIIYLHPCILTACICPFKIIDALRTCSEEQPVPPADFVSCIWIGLTSVIDLNSNPTQADQLVIREIDVRHTGPKSEYSILTIDGSLEIRASPRAVL